LGNKRSNEKTEWPKPSQRQQKGRPKKGEKDMKEPKKEES
jgi:hypothetical protein